MPQQNPIDVFHARSSVYTARGYDRIEAAQFVASVLDPGRDSRVLDVGTGKGLFARALAKRGSRVITVDPDAQEQALARELTVAPETAGAIEFVQADAATLPYDDGFFDAAASMDALHHLADPEPVLREMARTLAREGELLIADFSREGFEMVSAVHRAEGREHPDTGTRLEQAAAILHRLGFSTVLHFSRHLHDIAVFTRQATTPGQDILDTTRRTHHPHCLVCGGSDPHGLQLQFVVLPDRSVQAFFAGGASFQGFPDSLHGGVLAAVLESAMMNCLFSRSVTADTRHLEVRYHANANSYQPCVVTAHCVRYTRGARYVAAEIRQDGRIIAEGTGMFRDREPA